MTGVEHIAAAFAGADKRAALMPYLMGGFPDHDTSRRIGDACIDAGADLLELGIPFSDPLADGPVIQAAGSAALAAGGTTDGVLEVCAALGPRARGRGGGGAGGGGGAAAGQTGRGFARGARPLPTAGPGGGGGAAGRVLPGGRGGTPAKGSRRAARPSTIFPDATERYGAMSEAI